MSDLINKLLAARDDLSTKAQSDRQSLNGRLQTEYNRLFDDWKDLHQAIAALEDATDYGSDGSGIYRWTRFNGVDKDDVAVEFLTEYLSDRCVYLDAEHGALFTYIGPAIIINEDGDVVDEDGGRWFLSRRDYMDNDGHRCEHKRAYLIEQYMEKTGYWPGVFRCDRYGNVFPVNTQALAEGYNPE